MKTDNSRYVLTPDNSIVCGFKDALRRSEPIECRGIDGDNYEEMFALYADGNDIDKLQDIEEFLRYNPQLQADFDRWKSTSLVPNHDIKFENKELLKRRIINWGTVKRISVAASVVVALGFVISLVLKFDSRETGNNGFVAKNSPIETIQQEEVVDKNVESEDVAQSRDCGSVRIAKTYVENESLTALQDVNNEVMVETTVLDERVVVAEIEPKSLSSEDIIDQEMIMLEMMANAEISYEIAAFDESGYVAYRKPKRFIGKIFEGIAQIFKSTDKSEIRYMALEALGSDPSFSEPKNITSTVAKPSDKEEGFFILGIYVVKKKALDNGR